MECKKCPYFVKRTERTNSIHGGSLIVGFCKLRDRYISDETVGNEFCRDKATIKPVENQVKNKFYIK